MRAQDREIVIIGAGIIGLDVAWTLAQRGYGKDITVVARHLPGDLSIDYTSPWAGGNFSALSNSSPNALRWDRVSYPLLLAMADDESFPYVARTDSHEYWDEPPSDRKMKDMSTYLEDFRILTPPELVPGTVFGITFTTVTINAPMHASHLRSVLEARHGVRFLRQTLPSLAAAFTVTPRVSLVFNCVGGAAETFEGVRDTRSYPTRGQILVARAPGVLESVMRHGRDYETYIIPRPNSGDNVVLGGYMEKRARSGDVLREKSESIRRRTAELMPALLSPNVEVVAAATGLRPSRESGARVERENFGPGRTVVHNYGAGGTGFQSGMGMALDAVALVGQELRQIRQPSRL